MFFFRFEDLEENVQEEFYKFMEERKIDNDMSYFIVSYSRYKEEREYLNWLYYYYL